MRYGYCRVSTRDQDLSIQEAALKAAGCELIRAEKASGTKREGRAELDLLLQFLRPGDELVITRCAPFWNSCTPATFSWSPASIAWHAQSQIYRTLYGCCGPRA